MPNQNIPPEYLQCDLVALAQVVEANRVDFTRICAQAIRENIFTNRIELHPRAVATLIEHETVALITFLNGGFACAWQHGKECCQRGLSVKTIFSLHRAQRLFILYLSESSYELQNITSLYRMRVFEGYLAAREELVFKEQEGIRKAYEIALKNSNARALEAQAVAQKATETNYRSVILAQEEERRRISRELHDEAGQTMVGIRMSLENLNTKVSGNPELQDDLHKVITFTDNAAQQIRSMAYSLRPPVLDLLGLNLAIKQMCIDFSEQTHLIISYSGKETPILNYELSISIYRIVQESLTNIIKHARAKHAWVRLRLKRESIELSIVDDGQGFDIENVQAGIGLESMRERSRLLNGKMQVETAQGKSALLKFSFPIN